MPSASQIAAVMAEMDSRNKSSSPQTADNVKSMPAMNLTGLRSAMAGVLPGGWSSDHAAETEKYAGWHYIAINAVYKQVIQAGVEVYERRLVVPSLQKPQAAPPAPVMDGQQPVPQMPGGFTKGVNEQQESMVVMPHFDPVMKRLKRPNPAQTLSAFNGERAIQLCLTGRAITWNVRSKLTGKIIERYVIPTCLAQPRPPSRELPRGGWYVLPEGARYANEAGFYMTGSLEAAFGKTIPAEDVQVIKFPHPKYKDDGQSPISASALWTDTSEMVDKSRHNHLKNGPDPSVVIGLDGEVDETSIRRGEAIFNERYAGVDKHGKAMFVTPAKTITPLTTAPKDMAYGDGFTQLRDAQLAIHGVPLAAVGLTSPTGREGLYAPLLQFIELSVQPILKVLGDEDSALYSEDEGREVEICYTAKKFNDEDLIEKQIQTDITAGVLTKGELRKLRGREPFGDERDEEICGAAAAPAAMPGMVGPDGQPVGPDGMPMPQGTNPEDAAAMMTKPTKQPFGRAMQGGKPRLASQIAKAFAKELEKYGIVKGGPGSGNHGHCGGTPDDGEPGGSRPAEECGNTPAQPQAAPATQTPPAAQQAPPAAPQAQPAEAVQAQQKPGRFSAANPHAYGIDPRQRRILSEEAFQYVSERIGTDRESELGNGPTANDRERKFLEDRGWVPTGSSLQARYQDFFAEERNAAIAAYSGRGDAARARALATDNFYGISAEEAQAHLDTLGSGGEASYRTRTLITQAVGNYSAENEDGAKWLASTLAAQGLNETQIVQSINLMRASQGGNWARFEPGDAARIAVNALADPTASPPSPTPPAQSTESPAAAPKEKTSRVAPEPVDGTQYKENKLTKDIKERAAKVSFADGGVPVDEDKIREDLELEAEGEFPDYEHAPEIASSVTENMRESLNSYSDLPRDIRTEIDSFLETFGDEFTESISAERSVERFWENNESDFEDAIKAEAGDDEEKLSELTARAEEVFDDLKLEARNAAEKYESAMDSVRSEWVSNYINDYLDERVAEAKGESVGWGSMEPNTWHSSDDGSKLKLVTRSGNEFHLEVNDELYADHGISGKVENMIFTDKKGSIEITGQGRGEQFEVFRGVSSALLARMQNEDIDVLTYTAIEPNRQELYDKLTQTLAQVDGKYVAVVTGGGSNRSANYIVAKREHAEKLREYIDNYDESGGSGASWLVKQYFNGFVKSHGKKWARWYDYAKGGAGSGNFGHCGGDGGEGNPGGSKPADECGTGKKKPATKKPSAKKETAPKKGGKLVDLENPGTLEVHPDSKEYAGTSGIKIDASKSDGKEWNHAPTADINKWNKENGFTRKGVGKDIDLVDYAKKLDEAYGGPARPFLVEVPNPSKDNPDRMSTVISKENVERAAVALADMVEKADKHNPEWALWYSEIKGIRDELSEEKGKFNFSPASRELLKTDGGAKLFVGILAMTSQEGAPEDNLVSTQKIYDHYTEHGELPEGRTCRQLIAGKAGIAIAKNIEKYKKVAAHFDGDFAKTYDFLNKQVLARDLHGIMAEMGIVKADAKDKFNPGAFADQYVPISFIFGPKIGAFHGNLGELPGVLTQDRWNVRTWGRLTGQIGFTEEQITNTWVAVTEAKDKPTAEHVKISGMSARDMISAAKRVAAGDDLTDSEYVGLNKLAQAHVSSGKESKNPIIKRNDFTTKLNTAMKKITTVVDSPGGALERFANQLAAETAVEILATRGNTKTVREVQASAWMVEKKAWYDAGVGNKRGGENSYAMALEKLRLNGIRVKTKKELEEEGTGDE